MKVASVIAKIVVALAAIAGIVYVVATYGDKIVAWAKKTLGSRKCCCEGECECECEEVEAVEAAEEAAEEAAPAAETDVVANEADFEG